MSTNFIGGSFDRNMIYFDHNATTYPTKKVCAFIKNYLRSNVALNASSVHFYGRTARVLLEESRNTILEIICGKYKKEYELIFTGSATEANNQVMETFKNNNIYYNITDHPSITSKLEKINGIPMIIDKCGVIQSRYLKKTIANAHGDILVTVNHGNSETGIINELKKPNNTYIHYDITQTVSRMPHSFMKLKPDYITFSGHKIGGISGAGCLLYHKNAKIKPLIHGGGQEFGLRSGTENVIAIKCMAIACKESRKKVSKAFKNMQAMQQFLENKIIESGGLIFGNNYIDKVKKRLPNTSMIIMPNVINNTQLIKFDRQNIAVSAGSACTSGKISIPKSLQSLNVETKHAKCAIRVSISPNNTMNEINRFCDVWNEIKLNEVK